MAGLSSPCKVSRPRQIDPELLLPASNILSVTLRTYWTIRFHRLVYRKLFSVAENPEVFSATATPEQRREP